ncbi:MAG: VTT domain-containing protein [Chloroflexi bacterium]|nr:VTT domain-containing protein [Chloroflexota bacterium]
MNKSTDLESAPLPLGQGPVSERTQRASHLAALLLAAGITVAIIVYRDRLAQFEGYGYFGVWLIALLGNATVAFPVPSLAIVFAAGSVFNPLLVGLVAGLGEPLGELTGYLAGYAGQTIVENTQLYARLEHWMRRYGALTIFVLSVIPNPIFDLAGFAAGALEFPLWKFLLFCWMGKTIKATLIAYAGAYSITFVEQLIH